MQILFFIDSKKLFISLISKFLFSILSISFFKTKIKKTVFNDSQLRETDFAETDLTNAVFHNCDLMNAVFDRTILEKADFRTSYNYTIHPEANRIKKARFSVTGIVGLLGKYDIDIEE